MSVEYINKWLGFLDDVDSEMSRIACEKLAKTQDPAVVQPLTRALRNRPLEVRAAAARALGEIGQSDAVPALVEALGDMESTVSCAAAYALGDIRDPSAVPALRGVLHNYRNGDRYSQLHGDDRGLYLAALQALRQIGTSEAREAIAKYDSW